MQHFSHEDQQRLWEEEHTNPTVLLQMDSEEASGGVTRFWDFLQQQKISNLKGLEMGCGKGRNVIWLAQKGAEMYGFDFSTHAIEEAKRRAEMAETHNVQFSNQDATKKWDFESESFDFAIDCFASTDIESSEGRSNAISEFHRVLKPAGYLMAYLLSTDDEFHQEMIEKYPSDQKNAFHHQSGKFEKTFSELEIQEIYKEFNILKWERIEKMAKFGEKDYYCKHHWLILSK
jgi:ubiquinone/menaquinone biosynthesis C-methylase UbiE